ncbi:MAG: large-conductance mechanosensitive channel protein MscL, partial [Gammaproteobacteria bacterium]
VGIIIGAAFGKIISSLVADVIMPPIGVLMGGVDFKGLSYTLQEAVDGAEAVTLNYGAFIQNVVDFVIVAMAIFLVVKLINSAKKKEEAKPTPPPKQEVLLEEIRDLLKK